MDDPAIDAQSRHPRQVVVRAEVEGEFRHAARIVAVLRAARRARDLRIIEGRARHHAKAAKHLAIGGQFEPAHARFAVVPVDVRRRIGDGVRLRDLEDCRRRHHAAPVSLHARFVLVRLVRRERLSRICGAGWRGAAIAQTRREVAVHRNVRQRLDHDARERRDRLLIDRALLHTRGRIVVILPDRLTAQAARDQHAVIEERHRIDDLLAVQARLAAALHVAARDAHRCERRRRIEIGRHRIRRQRIEIADLLIQARHAGDKRVPDAEGIEVKAQARIDGLRARVLIVVPVRDVEGARSRHAARVREVLLGGAVVLACRAVHGHVLVDVILGARHHGRIAQLQLRAGIEVVVRRRHGRHGSRRAEADLRTEFIGVFGDVVGVERPAQLLAAVVQPDRAVALKLIAVRDARLSVLDLSVEADAPLAFVAEAAADIGGDAELAFGLIQRRQTRERRIVGAFGDDVDRAADAAARSHAVHQRARAFEHFHAFEQIHGHARRRNHAVEAIERNVGRLHIEAANLEDIAEAAATLLRAHRGVVGDDIGDGARLCIADHLLGVVGRVERLVHHVRCPEHPDAAASRHLSARVGRGQVASLGGALDHDGGQRRRLRRGAVGAVGRRARLSGLSVTRRRALRVGTRLERSCGDQPDEQAVDRP
ncbi:hypothetical protein AWB80_07410 [Caballeronia pedi]|uniref:Uncharacterized protein n=1 Tax=Caballeronia pedi TaxID=1777141 RepID=A0A158DTB0_9BURK|nr:hypothetical protein AWB80_07410 [Caballeronia pedi]